MNLLRKLLEVTTMRLPYNSSSSQSKYGIGRKELTDFLLLAVICFMIVVYKLNKA